MSIEINENSSIAQLYNLEPLPRTMFTANFSCIKELLYCPVFEMVRKSGITLFMVACLKKSLNEYGYHLIGEEIIDYSDFLAENRKELAMECNKLVGRRSRLLAKERPTKEEVEEVYDLTTKIDTMLAKIMMLRISTPEEELKRIHCLKETL